MSHHLGDASDHWKPLVSTCYQRPYTRKREVGLKWGITLRLSGNATILFKRKLHPKQLAWGDHQIIRILFLSANPENTPKLALTKEINGIREAIQSARFRSEFEFDQWNEQSLNNLQKRLLDYNPNVVHFSGHGSEEGVLLFQDSSTRTYGSGQGNSSEEPPLATIENWQVNAIAGMFGTLNVRSSLSEHEKVRAVILNACYSEKLAKAIAKHVDCVVGMNNAVRDDAAIVFAQSFYQALGSGESILDAFRLGKNQVALLNLQDQDIPKLKVRHGVDASKTFLTEIKSDTSLPEGLKYVSMGSRNREQVIKQIDHLKELAKKPYMIELLYKGKDETFKLPVLFGRTDSSFMLVARDGTNLYKEIGYDALSSRISEEGPGHAFVYVKDNLVCIKDLGSKNGTLVESTLLKARDSATLNTGDRFIIGNTGFVVKDIVTEIKHIAQSEDLWRSFKYMYVSFLDRVIEDNDLLSFISKLEDFREQFEETLDSSFLEELDKFIAAAKLNPSGAIDGETKNKWKSTLKDRMTKS